MVQHKPGSIAYLVIVICAMVIGYMAYVMIAPEASCAPGDHGWIYDYQTLIAGGLALISAAIGVYFLAAQINQN